MKSIRIFCVECGVILYEEKEWRIGPLWPLQEKVTECVCGHQPLSKDINLKLVRIHIDEEDGNFPRKRRLRKHTQMLLT